MGDLFKKETTEVLSHEPYTEQQPPPMSTAGTARVLRTTMFKIADPANQKKLVEAYGRLAGDQKKVSLTTPYFFPLPLPLSPPFTLCPRPGCGRRRGLSLTQTQDGKPYILYMSAGTAVDPARSRGFTVVARSEFASLDDMRWYDEECPAHAALKETARGFNMPEPPLVVYHDDVPLIGAR